jgi:hypothetical protein
MMMETLEDSPRLEWWEEAERKAKQEEYEMLEEQEVLLESSATTRKEERTRAATVQAIRKIHIHADLAAYRPARSFSSEDSPRLHRFGRTLQIGARPLTATNHASRMVRAPPPPSSSSPRMRRSDVLY